MIKHATATTFVMRHDPRQGWLSAMVWHPIFQHWMMPGGHVEPDENPHQAALREVAEETGLGPIGLVSCRDTLPAVETVNSRQVVLPWWIVEHPVEKDNHLAEPHIHIDHKYVAVTDEKTPATPAAHPLEWLHTGELDEHPMFEDVRENIATVVKILESSAAR